MLLQLTNLSLGYDKVIFKGINATARKGEMIAVIGANGTGKSTLLKSISGIVPYYSGEVEISGKPLKSYSPGKRAELISFVPSQSPRVKNLSLFHMLAASCYQRSDWLGRVGEKEQILINETLKKVGLEGFGNRDSSQLSDGEFQRASIARSLVQDTQLILLDEPTAFLDIANKITITKLLCGIAENENKTVIFSTHDLIQAIQLSDKIWIMGYDSFFEGEADYLIQKGVFDKIFKDSSLRFDPTLFTFT